ncbi:MAG: hypothetical protein LBG77_02535 [Dysgonamonadaceae bacterium]|jgi:uncharacterized protein YfaS (alpha-2-macroglobulin family)|nr:hypothetical protein [Dysgonamonadaceae bacterium]
MKRFLFSGILFCCIFSAYPQVNQWDKVAELDEQALPKSALEVVNQIYAEAVKTGNSPEMIKTLIYRLKYANEIDQDVFPEQLAEIKQIAEKSKNPVEQAVLYSIIAQLSSNYRDKNLDLNQRKKELTDLVNLSIQPAEVLQKTPISGYKEVLIQTDSAQTLTPTLYDLLIKQGITCLKSLYNKELNPKIDSLYQTWIDFREQQLAQNPTYDNRFCLMMSQLERMDFNRNIHSKDQTYVQTLQKMQKTYEADDFCVEILMKAAEYCQQFVSNKAAYAICNFGIERYPDYRRIGLLKNFLQSFTTCSLSVESENTVYPGKNLELKINYKNISRLKIDIYKINASVSIYENTWTRDGEYKKSGVTVQTQLVDLKNEQPYIQYDTIIKIPINDLGNYEYVIAGEDWNENADQIANQQFSVSRLATVSRVVDGKREFLITDRISGKPISGAKIQFYQRQKNSQKLEQKGVITTDKLGLAQGGNDKNIVFYNASFGVDTAVILSPMPWISTYHASENNLQQVHLFTDRSIYRPGQTVYFKGIATDISAKSSNVITQKNYTVTFRDANGKEIANKQLKTNDSGSFSGEFTIPQGLLNGSFSIQSAPDNGYASIRVEEYKRPTFDIQFVDNERTYQFGDTIVATGNVKTFSGVNLQGVDVQYQVTRRSHWLCRLPYSVEQIAAGTVQTGESGRFDIHFVSEKLQQNALSPFTFYPSPQYYTYVIETTVTDRKGETQTSETQISVGEKSMYLRFKQLESIVDKNHLPEIRIQAFNLSDFPVPATGKFTVYDLKTDAKFLPDEDLTDEKLWSQKKQILSGTFTNDSVLALSALRNLPSGRYRIMAVSTDLQGREVTEQQDFTLTSDDDKRPPVPVYQWLRTPKTVCAAGEKAEIVFGSSANDVSVLYEIFQNDKRISLSRFELSNSNKKIQIPFLESYGEGISVQFSFVKDERFFTETVQIEKQKENKSLKLNTEVFRDRLTPGQREEWRISVKDAKNQAITAEILATMYDASLEKIESHNWNFYSSYRFNLWTIDNETGNDFGSSYGDGEKAYNPVETPDLPVTDFNWFGLNIPVIYYSRNGILRNNSIALKVAQSRESTSVAEDNGMIPPPPMLNETVRFTPPVLSGAVEYDANVAYKIREMKPVVQIRQNFAETAFFYPQLKTNEAGETVLSFTVPESNTTWKLMALAHTPDLKSGQLIREAVSQKQLMITPNIPRFMREGDRITLSANISNLSEETINGQVSIQSFNPENHEINILIADSIQSFSVEKGKTATVSWTFNVPSNLDLTALKIVAQSENFSDGEQHLIPILPNRVLVTETMPVVVPAQSVRSFDVAKWLQQAPISAETHRLTLELTANPAWYAVQALPSLSAPQSDNVLDWFAACYSNSLAEKIANSTPKIKQMIEIWTKQGGSKETLLSNLEKNTELKNILLEETPWVLEAQNESEQKQRLALLFDLNRNQQLKTQAFEKLQSLQCEDGGWAWFKGMTGSVSITQWILYGLKNLDNQEDSEMQKQALAYIDRQFKKHYENWKKQKNNNIFSLSTYELEYLFVRSMYPTLPLNNSEDAVKFYTSQLENSALKDKNLYHKALSAMILHRNGKGKSAQALAKSLREYATHKPDLGMFWANNRTNCFMSQSAVSVHTFILNALQEIGSTPAEMDEMKFWLLNQKRTQQWESVPATVNAIQALLASGSDWLETTSKLKVSWGNTPVASSSSEPGTGYLKVLKDLKSLSLLKIEQPANTPAYGALYHQYYAAPDKITAAGAGLLLEKALFLEKITENGKTLLPVDENHPLQTGDKVIVRLLIQSDRDMEFVALKDARAACFEPAGQLSGMQWHDGLVYYQSPKDASNNFFFSFLPKGKHVLEYAVYANAAGEYSGGLATIQCLYAPEFTAHISGGRIRVK